MENTKQPTLVIVSELDVQARDHFEALEDRARTWLEGQDPVEIRMEAREARRDIDTFFEESRKQIDAFVQSDTFQQTAQAGEQFLRGLGEMIGEGWSYGFEQLMKVPAFHEAAVQVEKEIDTLRHSTLLRESLEKTEEVVDSFNQKLFGKIRRFFRSQDQLPAKIYTFSDDTKQES